MLPKIWALSLAVILGVGGTVNAVASAPPSSFSVADAASARAEQPFSARAAVTIVDTPAVGSQVSAQITSPASPAPSTYTYQWSANGRVVDGYTSSTFTPSADLHGATLTVTATPVLPGYAGSTGAGTSAPSRAVDFGDYSESPVVVITGDAVVNQVLSAVIVSDAVPRPSSYTYLWSAGGGTVHGVTGDTLRVTPDLLGQQIRAVVIPGLAGYGIGRGGLGASDLTEHVRPAPTEGSLTLSIEGVAQVGRVLKVVPANDLSPSPQISSTQWFVDDQPIVGQRRSTLALTTDLLGKRVHAVVEASSIGYLPVTASTAPVSVVNVPTLALSETKAVAGGKITVSGSGFFGGGELRVELHSDPVSLGTIAPAAEGTFRESFAVPAETPAGDHSLVVLDARGDIISTAPLTVEKAVAAASESSASASAAPSASTDPTTQMTAAGSEGDPTSAMPALVVGAVIALLAASLGGALLVRRRTSRGSTS